LGLRWIKLFESCLAMVGLGWPENRMIVGRMNAFFVSVAVVSGYYWLVCLLP
jgi:hypothetical protein